MKQNPMIKIFTIVLLLIVTTKSRLPTEEPVEKELSIIDFQYNIFKNLIITSNNKNVIISPLSIHQIISLASNGALGSTQTQMISSLNAKNVVALNNENQKINEIINSSSLNKNLIVSNGIFTKCNPKENFIEVCKRKYGATVEKLLSAKQVNDWCAEKTNNKISKIIDSISQVEMILINAVYFKDQWQSTFNERATKKEMFNQIQNVDMMHQRLKHVNYFENENVQIIEIPYVNRKLSSVIILPAQDISIDIFLSNLSGQVVEEYMSMLKRETVDLSLPKFELRYEVNLNDIMQKLGMEDAFDPANAKFGNISEEMKLFISQIIHKTYLKVDENGTEAAAVTAMILCGSAMPKQEKIYEMKVDRPFFFGIKHSDINDMFLFMSKIEKIN